MSNTGGNMDDEMQALDRALPVWAKQLTPTLFYLISVATLGTLLFGYHLAELNAPQDVLTCRRATYNPEAYMSPLPSCIPMTELEIGLVTSLLTLGGLIGALSSGHFASKHGRLRVMQGNTLFFVLGPLAEALAPNVAILALGRFVSGLGAGVAVVVVPLYLAEIAPPDQRGFFGAFTQVSTCIGIVFTQFLGLFLSKAQLWRAILGTGGIIGFVQMLGLLFCLESPKWIADATDDVTAAKEGLQKIRGKEVDIQQEMDSWRAKTEEQEAESLLNEGDHTPTETGPNPASCSKENGKPNILTIWLHPTYRKPTAIIVTIQTIQQLAGINSIVFYGVSLLSSLLSSSSAILNLLVAIFNLTVTLLASPLVDRLGRKPCLTMSLLGMSASALVLAIGISTNAQVLSAIAVFTFVGSFALGLGPIPFILASELVGPEAQGVAQSWGLGANWASTFIVAQFFPVLNRVLGKGRVYYLFAAIGLASAAWVWVVVPETKAQAKEIDNERGHEENEELLRASRG